MRKKKRRQKQDRRRKKTTPLFRGNAWTMPSAAVAKTTYNAVLDLLLPHKPEDWTLVSGLFDSKPVLVFVWILAVPPRLVATAQRAIRAAGGVELDTEARTTLIPQILARRRGLQAKERFETLVAHHPTGKPWWDLDD